MSDVILEGGPEEKFRSRFMQKLLMGMSWPEYIRSLLTPFNLLATAVLCVGLPLIVMRFAKGLYVVTSASHDVPWGLFLGWGLFGGVPLSATGFVMATAYYIFGFRRYKPLVRLAVLTGLLGYLFAVVYLMNDLGKPWRIYYPMTVAFGTASVLFLVAWHVSTYLTVQVVEFSPAILEWLGTPHTRKWALRVTIGMTIAGIVLSTLHQSALGAMYLLAPGKLHPLWYSSSIPILSLTSAVCAAFAMVIAVSTLASKLLPNATDQEFRDRLPELTLGLGKAGAVSLGVYFVLKLVSITHEGNWALLATPWGGWFLFEQIGFVLVPILLFAIGFKQGKLWLVRWAAFQTVIGVLLNRLNVSIIALNWQLEDHLHEMIPPWREVAVVLTVTMIHIIVFRWVLNRMPVMREDPRYADH
jgi:Ni/Fe-hydrogenase subunit HybB-like protein